MRPTGCHQSCSTSTAIKGSPIRALPNGWAGSESGSSDQGFDKGSGLEDVDAVRLAQIKQVFVVGNQVTSSRRHGGGDYGIVLGVSPDGRTRILNMIHRDDAAGAVIAALKSGRPGEVYNVVDDEPCTQLTFFQWL